MQPKYIFDHGEHRVTPLRTAGASTLEIDGHSLDVRLEWHDAYHGTITINGKPRQFYAAQEHNRLFIHMDGKTWHLEASDEFSDRNEDQSKEGRVNAPMPGVVVDVFAGIGDNVNQGDVIMLIESMKLQTEIVANISGTIIALDAEPGTSFEKGAILVDISASDEALIP